jgi:hypothetical protein
VKALDQDQPLDQQGRQLSGVGDRVLVVASTASRSGLMEDGIERMPS